MPLNLKKKHPKVSIFHQNQILALETENFQPVKLIKKSARKKKRRKKVGVKPVFYREKNRQNDQKWLSRALLVFTRGKKADKSYGFQASLPVYYLPHSGLEMKCHYNNSPYFHPFNDKPPFRYNFL